MLTDPPLLFCDEPTTGLDSYSACTVITILRHLTDRGKAVVCTIHQPSSEVFFLFDRLCLLAPGGRLAYHGDSAEAKLHFERLACKNLWFARLIIFIESKQQRNSFLCPHRRNTLRSPTTVT